MLALCSMLLGTYYAQNYASIIGGSLPLAQGEHVSKHKEVTEVCGHCFTCSRSNHKSRECSSTKSCRYCHRKHHQSICEMRMSSSGTANNTTSGSETTDSVTNTESVTSTANNIRCKGTILLQTARAIATNNALQLSRPVRVLFDNRANALILLRPFNHN